MHEDERKFFADLSKLLKEYVDKSNINNVNKSYTLLAEKSGVSVATISRYAQNEIGASRPSNGKVLAVLHQLLGSIEKAAQMMIPAYPDWWNQTGQYLKDKDNLEGSTQISLSTISYRILSKALTSDVFSVGWVKECFGQSGVKSLDSLLAQNLLLIHCPNQGLYKRNEIKISNIENILEYLTNFANCMKEDIENDENLSNRELASSYFWLNLDKKLHDRFTEIQSKLLKDFSILNDEAEKLIDDEIKYSVQVGVLSDQCYYDRNSIKGEN